MTIGSSGVINSTNVVKQSFANLYNLINNRTNVPDPNDSTGSRKFVYQRMPKYTGLNFAGFPFIVVSRSRPAKRLGSGNLTKSFVDYDFIIGVYTKDSGADSSGNPDGADQNETITENVRITLDSATNQRTLINYGMGRIEYNIDTDEDDLDGRSVFISEFDLRFPDNLTTTG